MDVLWKLVLAVGLFGSLCEGLSCKNEGGDDVDWFILYKKNAGFEYVYIDSKDQNLRKGNKDINHQAGVLAHTLEPYFDKSVGFIAYNDQPPTGKSVPSKHGHSKGVVMKARETAVWLLHSTPKFPSGKISSNFYPESGKTNAQIFLCVTLESTEFAELEEHLKDIKAYIFDKHNLEILIDPNTPPPDPSYSKNLQGEKFKRFVKTTSDKAEEGDLYVTIAETLQTDLYIQTWQSKPEDIYKTKTKFNLYNIENINTPAGDWKHGSDHSKWCVSKSKDWTCVADSNRQVSQFQRPGGALCIKNKAVADAFRDLIADIATQKRPASPSYGALPPKKKKLGPG